MENLEKWLKETFGENTSNIRIMTPQFERTGKLELEWQPSNEEEFKTFIEKAPWDILKKAGFCKWDTMSNVTRENSQKPVSDPISIPIVNAPGENFEFDAGRGDAPIEAPAVDEDIILFPGEWYHCIPNGFMVTGLYGEEYPFEKNKTDDDIRFGCLAYGIRRPVKNKA